MSVLENIDEPMLNVSEVAIKEKKSEQTIRRKIKEGAYPNAYKNGTWYIPESDVINGRKAGRIYA